MNKQSYILIDSERRRNCIEFIKALPANPASPLVVTITERTRTLEQNALMWACLHDVAAQVVWYGKKLTPECWKHVFSACLKGQETVPGINGGFVVIGQATSKMKVSEMRDLIELIFAFGAERGVKWRNDTWRDYEQFQAR